MTFEELESKYYALKGKHAAGFISNEEFQAEVENLTLQDEEGRWWMIGAKTGKWYVSQEGEWVQAEPPRAAPVAEKVCPQCGAPLEKGAVFCGNCGYRLGPAAQPPPQAPPMSAQPGPASAGPPAPAAAGRPKRGLLIGGAVVLFLLFLSCIGLAAYEYLSPGRPISRLILGPSIPQVVCTPPPCRPGEEYYCPDECPGGCGTVCATPTSAASAAQPTTPPPEFPTPTPELPTATPMPTATPSLLPPTATPLPTATPMSTATPSPTLGPTPTPEATSPQTDAEFVRILEVDVPDQVSAGDSFLVTIRYAWSFRDQGTVGIRAEGGGGYRGQPGSPTVVTGEGEFTHSWPVWPPDRPGPHTFKVEAYGHSATSPNLVDQRKVTVNVVAPTGYPEFPFDAETALTILPTAGELGVERLEYEERFTSTSMGGGFSDLPEFVVFTPDTTIWVELTVFPDADDAGRYMGEFFSHNESKGYAPVWTDLGDESFTVRWDYGEVVVRIERHILWCTFWPQVEVDLDQLRPSVQRLQKSVPSPTPTMSASAVPCEREAWGWFEGALEMVPGLREEIGCPVEEYRVLTAVSQDFQRGYMVWREEKNLISVFYEGDGWESYSDRWQEGMPELDPSFGPPPEGVIQPKRGFGFVWQEHPEVREGLGWAFNEERACDEAHLQEFHGGEMLECTQFVMPKQKTRIFILFDDGTYTIYMP